jgi:REP element-mobilizing transposase RayT
MPDEKYQNKYRIESARATWDDYSGGVYFITVCTKERKHFFGEISHIETRHATSLQMTEIGQCLYNNLQNVTGHYPYAEIPLFVVMPNHWHAIVFLDGERTPYIRRNIMQEQCSRDGARPVSTTTINEQMQQIDSLKGWLSVVIGGIKSAVTKFAHENEIDFAWQTRFHDHIIHNRDELNEIADYIGNNPATWDADCFNEINE